MTHVRPDDRATRWGWLVMAGLALVVFGFALGVAWFLWARAAIWTRVLEEDRAAGERPGSSWTSERAGA